MASPKAFLRAWSILAFSSAANPPRSPASNPGTSRAASGILTHSQGIFICRSAICTAKRRFLTLDFQCGPCASISFLNYASRSLMMARLMSSHSRSLIEGRAGGSKGLSGSWIWLI